MDETTDAPTVYEWRRLDGNLLARYVFMPWQASLWPFQPGVFEPVGPVQVWRQAVGAEPELIAETPNGFREMVVYAGGRVIPVIPPRNPYDQLP